MDARSSVASETFHMWLCTNIHFASVSILPPDCSVALTTCALDWDSFGGAFRITTGSQSCLISHFDIVLERDGLLLFDLFFLYSRGTSRLWACGYPRISQIVIFVSDIAAL